MKTAILVADDNPDIITSIELLLGDDDYDISSVSTPADLLNTLANKSFELILMDLNYQLDSTSGKEGLELLHKIRKLSDIPVIVMTGWATIELAIHALQQGANDFIQKPWQNEHLVNSLTTQLALYSSQKLSKKLSIENEQLRHKLKAVAHKIIAASPAMQTVLTQIEQLKNSHSNILLTGENGTGKTALARYIHLNSQRKDGPFVPVNMGSIAEGVFESELFGHNKGAFTGAHETRKGRFELAQRGTLFLDEIGNTPLTQQVKLLTAIEEKTFQPVGSSQTRNADVRIISATNMDLAKAIGESRFRQDLYYRLNTIVIHVPPLRERIEDIQPLVQQTLLKLVEEQGLAPVSITAQAIAKLQNHLWPGNIRELNHCLERAVFMCENGIIDAVHLHLSIEIANSTDAIDTNSAIPLHLTLDEIERQAIVQRLKHYAGNVKETATSLGLSRSGYYRRIEKHDL